MGVKRKYLVGLFFVGVIILFPVKIKAAMTLDNLPDSFIGDGTLDSGTEYNITVGLVDEEPSSQYYLKSFFSQGNYYFGYNWHELNSSWIKVHQPNENQNIIFTDESGNWSGNLKFKTDSEANGYIGTGEYDFKVKMTLIKNDSIYRQIINSVIINDPENNSICGNEIIEENEECDDGNLVNGDGCDAACQFSNDCGDGDLDQIDNSPYFEGCDDGNEIDNDGCSSLCIIDEVIPDCGNGAREEGEECDDGNLVNGDNCSDECLIENSPTSNVLINEFVPNPQTDQIEWIELYNANSSVVSLRGWTIEDNTGSTYGGGGGDTELDGLIIDPGEYLVLNKGDQFNFGLNNGGDVIILKNNLEETADQVVFGDGANIDSLDLENAVNAPEKGNSLARSEESLDTDIDKDDFSETTRLTPSEINQINEPVEEGNSVRKPVVEQPELENNEIDQNISYSSRDVVINELVSDPNDDIDAVEWVELFNNTDNNINLTGWTLEDGAEQVTSLSGNIVAAGFYVIDSPKGKLNNTGDIVILKSPDGEIIDQITYGSWDDGEISNNAPKAASPKSLARKIDGSDTNHDELDFVVTNPTKGRANEFDEVIESDYKLRVNEVLPNPEGSDNETEFIELYNFGDNDIDLTGFKLGDGSKRRYTIDEGVIKSSGFIVFERSQTGIALNNSGQEEIKLIDPSGKQIDLVTYSGSVDEDTSWAFFENKYKWTSQLTPGEINILKAENKPPVAEVEFVDEILVNQEIVFDASDSYDPEGEDLKYSWQLGQDALGDEAILKHTFDKVGAYQLKLEVTDNEDLTDILEIKIEVLDDTGGSLEISESNFDSSDIYISEFMPNPEGADSDSEWIEVCNSESSDIDLINYQIDDVDGGSSPYIIEESLVLKSNKCHIFGRELTGLALNNSDEFVRLINPSGQVVDEVYYEKSQEGASYAVDNSGHWFWTTEISLGEINSVDISNQVVIESVDVGSSNQMIDIELKNIRQLPNDSLVRTSGIVAVEPGLLGSQVFYLAGSGIQVYMYKKDFPDIELGDYIEVVGVLSESGGEKRIKLKEKADIIILEKNKAIPEAHQIKLDQVNDDYEGNLISFEGKMIEKSGSSMYIDDGTEEVRVYIKNSAEIELPKIKEGQKLKITGILSETRSGYRVLPRYNKDIKILDQDNSKEASADIGKIAELEASQRQEKLIQYLIITIVILFTALLTTMINNYLIRKKQNGVDK